MRNKAFKQSINAGHDRCFRNIGEATGSYTRHQIADEWKSAEFPWWAYPVTFFFCFILAYLSVGGL